MKKTLTLLLVGLFAFIGMHAQQTYPVNGVHDNREGIYALTNATVHTTYNQVTENATLLIKKGKVVAVGTSVAIPKTAVIINMEGKHIYPAFIEMYNDYGLPEVKKKKGSWKDPPQYLSNKKGAYGWNEAIKPETNAYELFNHNEKAAKEMQKAGFGAVLTHQKDGIARGSAALVLIGATSDNELMVKDRAASFYSFSKGVSSQDYPSSLMGSIALLRQTYYDAIWYNKVKADEEYNISLDSWNQLQSLPQIFVVRDRLEALRADLIGDEFNKQYIFKGTGDEYQRTKELKATGAQFIIPINFPKAYDVSDPFDAMNVSLEDMKHWELAPSNLSMLKEAGITFAITTDGLKSPTELMVNLRKAIESGLSKEEALKALTYTPASMLNAYNSIGSLETGKLANFFVSSDDIFEEESEIYETWVKGERNLFKSWDIADITGKYELNIGNVSYTLLVEGESTAPKLKIELTDSTSMAVKHEFKEANINLSFNTESDSINHDKLGVGLVRLGGWVSNNGVLWEGRGNDANGNWINWSAKAIKTDNTEGKKETKENDEGKAASEDKENKKDKEVATTMGKVVYPFLPYGWETAPEAETVLFKNATVWTNTDDGILNNTDVLIQNGKISKVGENLSAPSGAKEIDATGKHFTSGIIDEHSHIAISKGVNEGTQASSAEVSIATVINSEDINIYRQLGGGVTTAQLLHGSANPIGGQSGIIKFRWGAAPEAMKFEGADGFIKFALGENVKQSNWGDSNTTRFPQTRMGVEQVYMDHFSRAKEYGEKLRTRDPNVRRDIELDALLEIINSQRFITCHSYVQSEITMLMRVAETFGFRVNTFTHILEGYKVADKMQKHGAAGSTFSDWWGYKYEVSDAIPYNAAIMTEMGVLSSINSDDAEMARRLNQEAAKAVKYGGLSEEEAWKLVTLNPAKMLHIDNRVGSVQVGKDADVVLWSDNPLSIYAKAEQTYVDGICYYDMEQDATLRQAVADERNRLIQKMLSEKAGGAETQRPMPKKKRLYHCDDEGDHEHTDIYEEHKKGH